MLVDEEKTDIAEDLKDRYTAEDFVGGNPIMEKRKNLVEVRKTRLGWRNDGIYSKFDSKVWFENSSDLQKAMDTFIGFYQRLEATKDSQAE